MQCSFTPPLTPDDGSPLPFNEREEDCYVCCTISDIGPVGPPDFEEPVLQPQDGFPCICAGMEEFCPYCAWERELAERSQAPRRSSDLTLVATLSGPPSLQDTSSETPSQSQDSFQVLATATPPANDARRKLRKSRRVSSTPRVVSLALSSQSDATSSHTESFSSTSPDSPLLPSPKPGKALKKQQTPASPKEQTLPQNDAASSSTKSVSIIRSRSLLRPRLSRKQPRPKPPSQVLDTDSLIALAWTGGTQEVASPISEQAAPDPTQHSGLPGVVPPPMPRAQSSYGPAPSEKVVSITRRISEPLFPPPSPNRRRSLLRKGPDPDAQLEMLRNSWTMATAITDDDITDEKLVEELEEIRIKQEPLDNEDDSDQLPLGLCPPPWWYDPQCNPMAVSLPPPPSKAKRVSVVTDETWNKALRALLLCRELIQTERRYLKALQILIANGTLTPPPPAMLSYIPALMSASYAFIQQLEDNPSVQGVAEAFNACQSDMSDALVRWSSVVGQFFGFTNDPKSLIDCEDSDSRLSQLFEPDVETIVVTEPNKIKRKIRHRPAVRDIAIQPTQRIARYVLLFKELHSLTPDELPSYYIVEHAMRNAQTMAELCNQAHTHTVSDPQTPTSYIGHAF